MTIAKNIQTMIYTTRHRELRIEQLVPDINGGESGAPEAYTIPASLVARFMLSLLTLGAKLQLRKGLGCNYNEENIPVIICERDIL